MTPKIVVTGRGVLSAVGLDFASTWQAIINGQSGIREVTEWDTTGWTYTKAAPLLAYDPKSLLPDKKLLKSISQQDVLGIGVAQQAIDDSGLLMARAQCADPEDFNYRTGVFVASPGNKYEQQYDFMPLMAQTQGDMRAFAENLFASVHPRWLLCTLPNNVLAYVGILNEFKGPNHNFTNHIAGGAQAIMHAANAIRRGLIDRAVVVAYERGCEPQGMVHYGNMGLLSTQNCRPFNRDHDGTILAEGASAMVLEREDAALARSATIFGAIGQGSVSTDALGTFSIEADGQQLKQAMQRAINHSGLRSEDIAMVCAHGNGVLASDSSEALAITDVFAAHRVPVTAFKWSLGHTLTAAGVLETLLTLAALQHRAAPGIATLSQPCHDKLAVSVDHQDVTGNAALVITRGFGGINSCLVVYDYVLRN